VLRAWGRRAAQSADYQVKYMSWDKDGSKVHNKAAGSQRSSRKYDVRKGPFESGGGAAQQKAKGDG